MHNEQSKIIIDSRGNELKSKKDHKMKQLFINHMGMILTIGASLGGMLNLINSKQFASSCEKFYGVDRKYFSGTGMFEEKIIFILCAMGLVAYPLIFAYIDKKMNNKLYKGLAFFITILVLFMQNILYTDSLIDIIPWDWLKDRINSYETMLVFLIVDIIIAYFIIIRNFFFEKKKFSKTEKIVLAVSLYVYILNVGIGIIIPMNYGICDKKTYEVIEQNRAIISSYDGKFVVMDCEIKDEIITLKKGSYSLEEMTGVPITYCRYKEVICE